MIRVVWVNITFLFLSFKPVIIDLSQSGRDHPVAGLYSGRLHQVVFIRWQLHGVDSGLHPGRLDSLKN